MKLHQRVREIRESKGIRQNFVASQLNIPTSTYNAIELGNRPLRADLLQQIAEVLSVDPSVFFEQNFHEPCKPSDTA